MSTVPSLGRRPMEARDPQEEHRAASPLELFFDLVFVVAVGAASVELHHQLSEGHVAEGVGRFALVFFAVWWAWVNFTWFASSFDNDDWQYRLTTIVQMSGVLVLAAGAAEVTDRSDEPLVVGYLVVRLAVVSQWLRVARTVPRHAATAKRYALGITVVQVAWC